jgi:drug/metabolite transporter (DMT)-like permease
MGRRFDAAGTLAIAGNVLFWAATPVLLRKLTVHLDAWTANGVRYPLSSVLFWPVLAGAWIAGQLDRKLLARALIPAGFALGGQIFWALAPYYVEASVIGFLIKLSLVWALAGAMLLFPEERPLLRSPRFHAGLALALAGFLVLAVSRGAFEHPVTRDGILILLACGFFFGFYAVSVRYFLAGTRPLVAFGLVSQLVSAGTLVLMGLFGAPEKIVELSAEGWMLAAGSAILGIAISHVLYYTAILRLGASLSVSLHLIGPVVTLVLADFLLGESMSPVEWLGGMVLLSGGGLLLLAQQAPRAEFTRPVAVGGCKPEEGS